MKKKEGRWFTEVSGTDHMRTGADETWTNPHANLEELLQEFKQAYCSHEDKPDLALFMVGKQVVKQFDINEAKHILALDALENSEGEI